jgi:hypothetical protein
MIPKRAVTALVAALPMGLASAQESEAPLLIPPAPIGLAEDVDAGQADEDVAEPRRQGRVPAGHNGGEKGGAGPLLVPPAPSAASPEAAGSRSTPDPSSRTSSANPHRVTAGRPQALEVDEPAGSLEQEREDLGRDRETDEPYRSGDGSDVTPHSGRERTDRQLVPRPEVRRSPLPRPTPVTDHSSRGSRDETAPTPNVDEETRARYRLIAGEWWFQLRSGRWKYYRGGEWRDFDPATFEPLRVTYTRDGRDRASGDDSVFNDSPAVASGQQRPHVVLRPAFQPAGGFGRADRAYLSDDDDDDRWDREDEGLPGLPPGHYGPPGPYVLPPGPRTEFYFGPAGYEPFFPPEDEERRRRPVRGFIRGLFGRE